MPHLLLVYAFLPATVLALQSKAVRIVAVLAGATWADVLDEAAAALDPADVTFLESVASRCSGPTVTVSGLPEDVRGTLHLFCVPT